MWFILPFLFLIYFTSVIPDKLSQSSEQGTGMKIKLHGKFSDESGRGGGINSFDTSMATPPQPWSGPGWPAETNRAVIISRDQSRLPPAGLCRIHINLVRCRRRSHSIPVSAGQIWRLISYFRPNTIKWYWTDASLHTSAPIQWVMELAVLPQAWERRMSWGEKVMIVVFGQGREMNRAVLRYKRLRTIIGHAVCITLICWSQACLFMPCLVIWTGLKSLITQHNLMCCMWLNSVLQTYSMWMGFMTMIKYYQSYSGLSEVKKKKDRSQAESVFNECQRKASWLINELQNWFGVDLSHYQQCCQDNRK